MYPLAYRVIQEAIVLRHQFEVVTTAQTKALSFVRIASFRVSDQQFVLNDNDYARTWENPSN